MSTEFENNEIVKFISHAFQNQYSENYDTHFVPITKYDVTDIFSETVDFHFDKNSCSRNYHKN